MWTALTDRFVCPCCCRTHRRKALHPHRAAEAVAEDWETRFSPARSRYGQPSAAGQQFLGHGTAVSDPVHRGACADGLLRVTISPLCCCRVRCQAVQVLMLLLYDACSTPPLVTRRHDHHRHSPERIHRKPVVPKSRPGTPAAGSAGSATKVRPCPSHHCAAVQPALLS
jgi:hypothetical protein